MTHYVVIGDGISGSSAAETLREHDPEADITVITDEGEALYNRILIKEFAKGKLPEAPISIHEPGWYDERDITLELNTYVTELDTDQRVIETHEGDSISYDAILVATGGTPAQLPVDNSDADGIHHFWTFQDARAIKAHAESANHGVVIGAGLLGIDLAAICGAQGLEAEYLMRGDSWWRYGLTPDGASIIHDALSEMNVEPVLETGVEEFETDESGHVTHAIDDSGEHHPADFVGVAIGLNFNTEILQDTPVETDNGIIVDEHMRTNVDGVYAAGDITQFHDVILGERTQNGSWGSAKEQGQVAAKNMVGDVGDPSIDEETFRWVPSYSITHFEFPFLSFGHPTIGDESVDRKYSEREWRRLTFKDGKLIGGVLIGDLKPQSLYKGLIRDERSVVDISETLLKEDVSEEDITPVLEQSS